MLANWIRKYCAHYSGLPSQCWLPISLRLFNSIIISICYFLPIYFVNTLKFSVSESGIIIAFYSAGTMLGGVMGGGTADSVSPRIIVSISLLFQGLAFILIPFLHSQVFLIADLFILGIATYSFITTNFLWTLAYCEDSEHKKLRAINILETVANLGLGVAAIIISTISLITLQMLMIISGIFLFVCAAFLLINNKNIIDKSQLLVNQSPHNVNQLTSRSFTIVTLVLCYLFLVGLIISQLSSTYPIYLQNLFPKYNFGGFGLLFALNTFLIVGLQTPLANYCGHYNRILVVGVGAFLLGLGMLMLAFTFNYSFVIFACIVYTLGEMLFFSVAQLICYEEAPQNKRGFILGIYRMIYAFSRSVGPALGGYLYQQFSAESTWYLCGIIGIFCLFSSILTAQSKLIIRYNQ